MVLDKWYAVKNKWRLPESVLLSTAILGGGTGMVVAMVVARHKLSKFKFRLIGPLSILVQLGLFAYLLFVNYEWVLS